MTKGDLQFRTIIVQLMNHAGAMNESELARKVDLPQQTIHRLLSGATPDPRVSTLVRIARYFGVTIGQLLGEEPISPTQMAGHLTDPNVYIQIPLIMWEQINEWGSLIPKLSRKNWFDWVTTNISVSQFAYALKINDKSLPNPFSQHAVIIIDPSVRLTDSDIVVIYDKNTQSAMLKKLILEGKKQFVASLKEGVPPAEITQDIQICGAVIQVQSILKTMKRGEIAYSE